MSPDVPTPATLPAPAAPPSQVAPGTYPPQAAPASYPAPAPLGDPTAQPPYGVQPQHPAPQAYAPPPQFAAPQSMTPAPAFPAPVFDAAPTAVQPVYPADTPPMVAWADPSGQFPPTGPPALGGPPFEGKPKRSVGKLVTIILLAVGLAVALGVIALALFRLDEATTRINEQDQKIEEQRDLIDKKETFGAAMQELLTTAASFEGIRMGTIVPLERYDTAAASAWTHRWDSAALDEDIETITTANKTLQDRLAAANIEATTNVTGSTYETVTDQLGGGFVTSAIDDARTICGSDVLACVFSDDPYLVHYDAVANTEPHMTNWLRTGIAYHEFAHVLQMTNPKATEAALVAFGGDNETMADCFALTYLDGWTLDHEIWVSDYQYWSVNIGYGYTCNDSQRQVIRDWYEPLGFTLRPISQ